MVGLVIIVNRLLRLACPQPLPTCNVEHTDKMTVDIVVYNDQLPKV